MESKTSTSLVKVIGIDEDKCVNCHACITACPVKYCNDGSGDVVAINDDMCIACGNCLTACTHDSRYFIDDFYSFLHDVDEKQSIIAIVSPAVAANFPDRYLKLNGWLKSMGVKAVFDVSFGAELTVKSYINHIDFNQPKTTIAQPCAALVTYIELYQPQLIKHLAPVDSPMVHTMKMIREYYSEYRNCKIAVISPCNAKKREFEATGFGDYNIAYKSIANYIKDRNLSLENFPETDFDNPPAERAVSFSSPGGLLQTAKRWMPDLEYNTRKIEGVNVVYNYLEQFEKMFENNYAPLLVDCLSCEYGCNAGPLTVVKEKSIDEIEHWVNKRNKELKDRHLGKYRGNNTKALQEIEQTIENYWSEDLYKRKYVNRWRNSTLKYPNEDELKDIYSRMHKHTEKDLYNCSACGYGLCEKMAIAIFNGLNKPENCHFFLGSENEINTQEIIRSKEYFSNIIETSNDGFVQVDNDGRIVNVNNALKKMLKKSDLIGRLFSDFLDYENKYILNEQLKLRNSNKSSIYELALTDSENNKIFCMNSGTALYENGEKIGSFALITDITLLKKAQKELELANVELEDRVKERTADLMEALEELRTSNDIIAEKNRDLEKLSIVASKTDNAVSILDSKGNYEWVNNAFAKLYSNTFERYITEKKPNILDELQSESAERTVHDLIYEKKAGVFETFFMDEESGEMWIQSTITPILDRNKNITKIVKIDTDISVIKSAEAEISRQKEEIEAQRDEILRQRDISDLRRKNLTDSIQYAQRIQSAMLPPNDLVKEILPRSFVYYKPKDIVSGDFYWVTQKEGKTILAVADCTGHGVPGGFMSMLGLSFLNEIVNKCEGECFDPSYILSKLRSQIINSLHQTEHESKPKDGMDLALCVIDPENNEISFSGANSPLYLIRDLTETGTSLNKDVIIERNKTFELVNVKADKIPIGFHFGDKLNFTTKKIKYKPGERLYLFTDGYVDQFGGSKGRKLLTKNFRKLLLAIQDSSIFEQKNKLIQYLNEWRGNENRQAQVDDILIVGVEL